MSRKGLCIAVLSAMIIMLAASLAAQDGKNEVGADIGRIFISNQGLQNSPGSVIAFGKGFTYGFEYARRIWVTPLYSISAEVPVVIDHKNLLNAGSYGNAIVPQAFNSLFVTPAARVNVFPTTAVSPWASLGIGVGHIGEYKTLLYGGPNPGGSSNGFALEGGLGLDVRFWKQLSMRGGVRDFWSSEPDFPLAPTGKSRMHNYYVFGGAFWRF